MADMVERCLAKDPQDRYQSAGELGYEMQQVTFASDVEPIEITPPNYAMPFFLGIAVEAAVLALVGWNWGGRFAMDSDVLWYVAASAAALAIVVSPVARAATEPLDAEVRRWIRQRLPGRS
jgi:hypothetical protein